jgi:diguanylate cyclase (GGDEF)-like protein
MSGESTAEGEDVNKAKRLLRSSSHGHSRDAETARRGDEPAERGRRGSSGPPRSEVSDSELVLEEVLGSGRSGSSAASAGNRTKQLGEYDQLWQLSMADPHTGLANQLLLLDRLTQALARRRRHSGEVVVCHIDLENMAEINLDLGYATGNVVFSEVARRLTSVLRAEDTISRVAGNELVVGLTVKDEQAVGPLMRRLQHTLDEPVTVGTDGIRLRSSLGVAIAEDSESAEEVLARADRSTRVTKR